MLKLSDYKIWAKYPYFWHWLVNIVVATVWCYYAYEGLMNLSKAGYPFLNIALVFRNTSLTFVFLLRRPSKLTSKKVMDWIVAIAGTFMAYLYETIGTRPVFPALKPAAYVVMVAAAFLTAIAVINLGCSFSIVPANRGVKTKGLYAVVRHPLYLLYMLHDVSWILNSFSARNLCLFVFYCLLTYSRARREERILRQDPEYQEYASKTRYMFLPGII